jgi:hypothetical protein
VEQVEQMVLQELAEQVAQMVLQEQVAQVEHQVQVEQVGEMVYLRDKFIISTKVRIVMFQDIKCYQQNHQPQQHKRLQQI